MDRSHDSLIGALAGDLRPVRRLAPPALRTLVWLVLVAAFAAALAAFGHPATMWHRLAASLDMWLASLGAVATTVTAALAAFELSLPDRSRTWALLPLPAAVLWIGASGLGCLRADLLPGTHVAAAGEARDCLFFIVGLSVPLSIAMIAMLRRACSLAPALTAAMAGLAAAAAAATLLNLFHPFDAAATDLVLHATAVVLVIAAVRIFGGRALKSAAADFSENSLQGSSQKSWPRL